MKLHPVWLAHARRGRWRDPSLSVLLIVQSLLTFVAVPVGASSLGSPWLLDVGSLAFAGVCAVTLTERVSVRFLLIGAIAALAIAPRLWKSGGALGEFAEVAMHQAGAVVAFGFTVVVTALVARLVFSAGPVTAHRIIGAVLVYLNVAVLFAIVYDFLYFVYPGSLGYSSGAGVSPVMATRLSDLSYFSLTTITTAGYGDIVPTHPLARSLANLESTFGQLYPAIVLSRLVSLNLVHSEASSRSGCDEVGARRR